jgi:hypothetical protein
MRALRFQHAGEQIQFAAFRHQDCQAVQCTHGHSATFKAGTDCNSFFSSGMQEPQLVPAFSRAPIWAGVVRPSA